MAPFSGFEERLGASLVCFSVEAITPLLLKEYYDEAVLGQHEQHVG